jgi:hypothetical protein
MRSRYAKKLSASSLGAASSLSVRWALAAMAASNRESTVSSASCSARPLSASSSPSLSSRLRAVWATSAAYSAALAAVGVISISWAK